MSAKLDTSLDDILKTERANNRRGRGAARRSGPGRKTTATPVGGVQKPTKQAKPAKTSTPATPAGPTGGESKIMISNLPFDVEENQLKDYFATAIGVGRPKRVFLQYGPNGKSLGSATVIFHRSDQAQKATTALQGVKIDSKPVRVELLVSATSVAASATKQSTLADRVTSQKKDKPKPVTAAKDGAVKSQARTRGAARGRGGRGGRERTKKKTVEELDAEMADYFPAGEGGNDAVVTNGSAAAPAVAAGGDTMVDDML